MKVAIIGGGASGLSCAIAAAKKSNSAEITIYESKDRVGKKILATGNGRCNFTNEDLSLKHFYGNNDFLKAILSSEFSVL